MPRPESRPETWRALAPGENLIISDEATIKARMAEGKGQPASDPEPPATIPL